MPANQGSQKRYPSELKERAVRMVFETIAETGERHGVIGRVARQLGIGDLNRFGPGWPKPRSKAASERASAPRSGPS